MALAQEFLNHKTVMKITKFTDPDGKIQAMSKVGMTGKSLKEMFPDKFIGEEYHEGNVLVNIGIQGAWKLLCGLSAPPGVWSNANAKIRIGTGSGAASATDTQATFTGPTDIAMDSSYPQLTNQTIAFKATAGSGIANQVWNEFGVINSDGTPVLLNRFVTAKGTKASGETWTMEIDITLQ